MTVKQESTDALLLIAPGCPHCPTVLQAMGELVKQGVVGTLEVVNISRHPERAEALGVRSVPWLRLGAFELDGLHSLGELRAWAEKATLAEGLAEYFDAELKGGRLARVTSMVRAAPQRLDALLMLAENPDTELTVRIGVSAVVEAMAAHDALVQRLPALAALAASEDPRVRADACHFLAQTRSLQARPLLEKCLKDPERAVREVAQDSLDELNAEL